MIRRLLVPLCLLALALFAPPAFAQSDDIVVPDTTPAAEETPTPDETAAPDDTAPPDDSITDGDYVNYCTAPVGTDGDYVYCAAARGVRRSRPRAKRDRRVAVTQALPDTLPLTGGSPFVVALIGLGFVLTGAGGRLRTRA